MGECPNKRSVCAETHRQSCSAGATTQTSGGGGATRTVADNGHLPRARGYLPLWPMCPPMPWMATGLFSGRLPTHFAHVWQVVSDERRIPFPPQLHFSTFWRASVVSHSSIGTSKPARTFEVLAVGAFPWSRPASRWWR